jgi:hypothetical protein
LWKALSTEENRKLQSINPPLSLSLSLSFMQKFLAKLGFATKLGEISADLQQEYKQRKLSMQRMENA